MKQILINLITAIIILGNAHKSVAQATPIQVIEHLRKGINIGNTLDAPPGETSWHQPEIQSYYFDDYKKAGFTAVRIPVTWEKHTANEPPYLVDPAFISRVEQVVDWGLSRGLYIIVNCHHEEFIKNSYSAQNVEKFEAIWNQIANKFKKKSDHLLFEILNEPHPMTLSNLNDLNTRIIKVIRKTNPTRIVVFAGTEWSSASELMRVAIPEDKYLIANFHCYSPWSWVSGKDQKAPWGTETDRSEVKAIFDSVYLYMGSKRIPVMVNEYGCPEKKDHDSRVLFYKTYIENITAYRFGSFAWDDGGDFKTYDRLKRRWIGDVQEVITGKKGQ